MDFSTRAAERHIRHRHPSSCQRSRVIATPPKLPPSPARHKLAARKRVVTPKLAEAATTPGTPRKKTIVAGPLKAAASPRKSPRKTKTEPSVLDKFQATIVASLEDDKAENVVTLRLEGKAMFCDRMVIATGLADRQIGAMAQHLKEKLHELGQKRVQIEGLGSSDWVLIDAGDIVVHLFKPEARLKFLLSEIRMIRR